MAKKSVDKSKIGGRKSETVTERIFMDFYGINTFMEKSEIPSRYGFKSKKGTSSKGFPDFFRDDDEEDYVIIVEAKADDFTAACDDVEFYAKNNNIDKDIVAISISGQNVDSYKAGLFFLLKNEEYKKIKTDGKLLRLKDISKLYRKEKFGDSITTEALKKTIKNLNKDFQDHNIKDTERSLFFAGLMIALKDNTFARTYQEIQEPTGEEKSTSKYKLTESHNLNLAIQDAIVRQISNKINNLSKEYNWRDRFSFIKNIDYPLVDYKELIKKIEEKIYRPFRMDEKQDILGRAY